MADVGSKLTAANRGLNMCRMRLPALNRVLQQNERNSVAWLPYGWRSLARHRCIDGLRRCRHVPLLSPEGMRRDGSHTPARPARCNRGQAAAAHVDEITSGSSGLCCQIQ